MTGYKELAARLRKKRMRVHDLSGVGWEDDPAASAIEAQRAELEEVEAAVYGRHERGFVCRPLIDPPSPAAAVRARIEALEAERDEARALVAEANNSLYGSQGYFHSLDGGPFDKHHLANGIERLKEESRKQWWAAHRAEAALEVSTFTPWLREWCKARFGKWITHNTAKGALADLRARLALQENTNGG